MFYGWAIVALAFVSLFVVTGALIQCFPVFLLPLAEEFGVGRAEASMPVVAIMVSGIVISPLVGRAVGRFPIRNVMLAGALVMASGFYAVSGVTAFWQVVVLYGLAGSTALGSLGIIACNSLVVNWFERRRAMALGIAMIGMSISGAVLIPIATWAVGELGWRLVYQGFAGCALCLTPLIAWLAVSRPEEMGLVPDGKAAPPADEGAAAAVAAPIAMPSTRELLASPSLWLIAAACGLVFFGSTGIMNHGMAFATDRGIEPMHAAALLSAISVGAAIGKLLFGWLSDRLGERGAFWVAIACCAGALTGFIALSSYAALVASAGLYGLGIGGVSPLQAVLLARGFGARRFGPVMGLIGPLMIPFQITGPPLAGFIHDTRGSYDLALWIFLAALVAAAASLQSIRLEADEEERAAGVSVAPAAATGTPTGSPRPAG